MQAEFRLTVRKDMKLDEPFAELPPMRPPRLPDCGRWAFIASAPQTMDTVRNVVNQATDFRVVRFGLTPELAYTLCAVALDRRLSQVVNTPQVTVTGTLAKNLFP